MGLCEHGIVPPSLQATQLTDGAGQSPSGAGTEKSYPPYHLLTRHYASYVKTWRVDHPAANMSTPDCHEPDKASTVVWSAQADIEAPLTTSVETPDKEVHREP